MRSALSNYPWQWLGAALLIVGSVTAAAINWRVQYQSETMATAMAGGDPARAPALIRRYGCAGCHTIPGIPGGDGQVGGPLADIRHRVYVGGVITNSPDNLVHWIVSPQTFSPRSAMPATGISEAEARDVATYLYSR
jgi:mono/diheme cytochrome c family protein